MADYGNSAFKNGSMKGRAELFYDAARELEKGRVTHLKAAIVLYQMAAALHYEPAIIRLAYLLDTIGHRGLRHGTKEAMIALGNAARFDHVRSMRRYLAYLCQHGIVAKETCHLIVSLLTKLVDKDDPLMLYCIGRGQWDDWLSEFPRDPEIFPIIDPLTCLKKAAGMGVIRAKTELAARMRDAMGGREEVDKAVFAKWIESAEAGDAEALQHLLRWTPESLASFDLREFATIAQDYALHHGDVCACIWLAMQFWDGSRLPEDLVVSCRYFRRYGGLGVWLSSGFRLPGMFGEQLRVRIFVRGCLDRVSLSVWPPPRRVLKIRQ